MKAVKIGAALLAATLLFSVPEGANASTPASNGNKIDYNTRRLKALTDGNTNYIRIQQLVIILVELNPQRAARYYEIGLSKLAAVNATDNAKSLKIVVVHLVNHSGLANDKTQSIIRAIDRDKNRYIPPGPTPPPVSPSAMWNPDSAPVLG